ncbi:MAG: ATP-binding protein, partial [Thermodesulfobacteriota bacterium]
RINAIVTDFLDISRPSGVESSPADVFNVLEETVAIMKAHKGFEGVTIEMEGAAELPPAMIDSSKLKQVFMNLLLNSADAMEGSGIISVETKLKEGSAYGAIPARRRTDIQRVFPPPSPPKDTGKPTGDEGARTSGNKTVVISFTDNGPGIGEEERKKIFDPFFTTKEPGKGTGLGLFISEGIVEAYRGRINVRSKLGEGTTFEVSLEAMEEAGRSDKATAEANN